MSFGIKAEHIYIYIYENSNHDVRVFTWKQDEPSIWLLGDTALARAPHRPILNHCSTGIHLHLL